MFSVTHGGPPEVAERDWHHRSLPGEPALAAVDPMPYLDVQRMFDDEQGWGHRVYAKSVYVDTAPDALIETLVEQASAVPAAASLSMGALGGAIADVPEDATAYAGRNATFEIAVDGSWDDPKLDDEVMGWARRAMTRIEPFRTTGVYANSMGDAGEDVAGSSTGTRSTSGSAR